MQIVSNKLQSIAQSPKEQIHGGQTVQNQFQVTAHNTGQQLDELGHSTTSALTNVMIDAQESTNEADTLGLLDGLYRAISSNWLTPLEAQMSDALADLTVKQAEGRQGPSLVHDEDSSILAAPDQMVTSQVFERATSYKKRSLPPAVGLSAGAACPQGSHNAMSLAGNHVQCTTHRTSQRLQPARVHIQSGEKGLGDQLQATTSNLQDCSAHTQKPQISLKNLRAAQQGRTTL